MSLHIHDQTEADAKDCIALLRVTNGVIHTHLDAERAQLLVTADTALPESEKRYARGLASEERALILGIIL